MTTTEDDLSHGEDVLAGLIIRLTTVAESIRFILLVWTFLTVLGAIVLAFVAAN